MQMGCLRSRLFSCKYCNTQDRPSEGNKNVKMVGLITNGSIKKKRLECCVAKGVGNYSGNMNNNVDNHNKSKKKSFVEALREAQPYIFAFTGRTFVVVLSAEVVAGPCLDSILKVLLKLSLSLSLYRFSL